MQWNTPQGTTQGTVVDKLTSDVQRDDIGAHGIAVSASAEEPKFVVESDSSGKHAVHKAEALKKL